MRIIEDIIKDYEQILRIVSARLVELKTMNGLEPRIPIHASKPESNNVADHIKQKQAEMDNRRSEILRQADRIRSESRMRAQAGAKMGVSAPLIPPPVPILKNAHRKGDDGK
jgi:hypothetical protein